jgi:hypothetical protein
MELLASVHWVASHSEEQAKDLESVFRAICVWSERKRRIMKPEHIRIAWERLREKGWLPAEGENKVIVNSSAATQNVPNP